MRTHLVEHTPGRRPIYDLVPKDISLTDDPVCYRADLFDLIDPALSSLATVINKHDHLYGCNDLFAQNRPPDTLLSAAKEEFKTSCSLTSATRVNG